MKAGARRGRAGRPAAGGDPPHVATWPSLAAGAALFAVYAASAPAVAGDKDSGEFTLVLATRGLAHPTGYPLYTLTGSLFAQLAHALGATWAQAANLFSALGGGVAMAALHAVGARLLASRLRPAVASALAVLPLLAFGLNPLWTLEATLAEVNAWHLAWVGLAALSARRALAALAADRLRRRDAALWGAVVGTGLAHHATSVLFALPLSAALAVALARSPARHGVRLALALAALAGTLVPLSAWSWVAWRAWHPAVVQWPALGPSWTSVADHLGGAQYRAFLGRFAPSAAQRAHLVAWVFPWLVPAVAGALAALAGHDAGARAWRRALGVSVLLQAGYAFLYGVSDPAPYFLPALAIGLALALDTLAALTPVRRHGRVLALAAGLALVVPAAAGARAMQARHDALVRLDDLLRRMWASLPPGPALVVWDDDMASRLVAFQLLERRRPDVEVVQPRHLTHAIPRARFTARHGFDPVAGVAAGDLAGAQGDAARSAALVEAIATRINERSPSPVVLFRPDVPSMRLLTKPGAVADSARAGAP